MIKIAMVILACSISTTVMGDGAKPPIRPDTTPQTEPTTTRSTRPSTDVPAQCTFNGAAFSKGAWICTVGHMREVCTTDPNGNPMWSSITAEPACGTAIVPPGHP
jgi:hypothetical protein